MKKVAKHGWLLTLLGSGLIVAIFTFAAPIVWTVATHRSVGPDYVSAALHVENGTLLLLVRNSSNDPLDLVEADFEIKIPQTGDSAQEFGAYPAPSHLYEIDSTSATRLKQQNGQLLVTLKIAQAIEAGQVDQFGFKIRSLAGPFVPPVGSLVGTFVDTKGNIYPIKY
jgi:hypothetical protein